MKAKAAMKAMKAKEAMKAMKAKAAMKAMKAKAAMKAMKAKAAAEPAKGNAKKQLSFLHVYHHSSIGLMWGILLMYDNAGGTARYGAMINSVTHVFMYSHYLWTSFGRKNPFKALLTKWQIAQFYSCFVHAVLVLTGVWIVETVLDQKLAWLQFCYHITM